MKGKKDGYWYYLIHLQTNRIKVRVTDPAKLGFKYRIFVNEPPDLIMRKSKLLFETDSTYLPSLLTELDPSEALMTGVPIDEWAGQARHG